MSLGEKKDGKCRAIAIIMARKRTYVPKTCKAVAQRGHSFQS